MLESTEVKFEAVQEVIEDTLAIQPAAMTFDKKLMAIRSYLAAYDNGKVGLPTWQRPPAPAWDKPAKQDGLFQNILSGNSINAIHVSYDEDGVLKLQDGQQRLRVIRRLVRGEYTPSCLTGEWQSLNGVVFTEWPAQAQENIMGYMIDLTIHKLDEHALRQLFLDLNRPAPLTSAQQWRGKILAQIKAVAEASAILLATFKSHLSSTLVGYNANDVEEMTLTALFIARQIKGQVIYDGLTEEAKKLSKRPSAETAKTLWDNVSKMKVEEADVKMVVKAVKEITSAFAQMSLADDITIYNAIAKRTNIISLLAALCLTPVPALAGDKKESAAIRLASGLIEFFACTASTKKPSDLRMAYFNASGSNTGGEDNVVARVSIMNAIIMGKAGSGFESGKRPDKKAKKVAAVDPAIIDANKGGKADKAPAAETAKTDEEKDASLTAGPAASALANRGKRQHTTAEKMASADKGLNK